MNKPYRTPTVLDDVVAALQLQIGAEDQAYGEIHGSPVTATVLGMEPPALLFAFRIQPAATVVEMPADVQAFVRECSGDVSIENGIAWLSLDNLVGKSPDAIVALVQRFALVLSEFGLRIPEGCQKCGSPDELRVVYADRRAIRLCGACLADAEDDITTQIADQTRPHVGYAAGMPFVFLLVSGGWAILWFCVEMYLDSIKVRAVEIRGEDGYLMIGLLVLLGGGIGWPTGVFLRRSGLASWNPWAVAAIAVVFACILGEWLFLNALVVRRAGILDVVGTTRSFLWIVTGYNSSWVVGKIIVAGAIVVGCGVAANIRPTVAAKA